MQRAYKEFHMNWTHDNTPYTDNIYNHYGYIYCITYTDSTKYVGKKNFYKKMTLPALKSGEIRPGAERIHKNINRKRKPLDVLYKESDWKTYNGSSKLTEGKEIQSKEILCFANSKRHLTYLEVKYLFILEVLESDAYLNENILGKFYNNVLE